MTTSLCALCGKPMPVGEEMFKYHGYSGPCPGPTKPNPTPSPSEKLRTRLERIAWKHYQPRTSTNVEAMLDDMTFELSEERERIAGEVEKMKHGDDYEPLDGVAGDVRIKTGLLDFDDGYNEALTDVLSIIRGDKE